MGGVRWVLLVAGCAACGRIGFGGDNAPGDGPGDGVMHDAPELCSPSWDLCDNFETGISPVWTLDPGVVRDPAVSHRGGASMHMITPAIPPNVDASAVMFETATLAAGVKPFWVRVWVKAIGLPAGTNGLELIAAEQPGNGSVGDYLFEKNGTIDVYTQFTQDADALPLTLPNDTWTCLVWSVVPLTTLGGSITLSGDLGNLSLTSTTDAAMHILPISIGIHFANTNVDVAQPQVEMWVDDVIVHHAAVTCAD